jgi:hypothetical protein
MSNLDPLVGEWILGDPAAPVGRTSFTWLEGNHFLIQRWTVDIPGAPDGIAILDGERQHYFDSRGIARVYQMSLADGVWQLWRAGDDFHQRFTGRIDGATITGAWEISPDGERWEHDFDLVYTKVG